MQGAIWYILPIAALVAVITCLIRGYHKAETGKALLREGLGGQKASLTSLLAIPLLQQVRVLDVSLKRVDIARRGPEAVTCQDNIPADLLVTFYVRVIPTPSGVLDAVQRLGPDGIQSAETISQTFANDFSTALDTTAASFTFTDLFDQRERFKEAVRTHIGQNLGGFELYDVAIDHLEKTPPETRGQTDLR